jgi:hypothetical protein
MKNADIISNLINGNLTDAKKAAKRRSFGELRDACRDAGMTEAEAHAAADYLKGVITFQQYCDAPKV